MQVIIGGTDITQYIQERTYDIESEEEYESWTDANYIEHKDITRSRVVGSFQMVFFDGYIRDGSTVDAFADILSLISSNTQNGVTPIQLTINNKNALLQSINAFLTVRAEPMVYTRNGSNVVVKRVTIEVREQ